MATIGVDVGGTNITAAEVHGGEAHHHAKVATPSTGPDELISTIVDLVAGIADEHDLEVDRVGIGAPGTVDPAHGVLQSAPNLHLGDEPVALAMLVGAGLLGAGRGNIDVRVDNDVNVAARGEWRHGAGRGHDDLLAVWWGTGIGGGLILDGRVRTGTSGSAGEIGHIMYAADGRLCGCGHAGHVEAYAGRAALEAEARRRYAAGEPTKLVELAGEDRMKSRYWAEALDAGDVTATSLLDTAAHAIGIGIASAVTLIDVEVVVLGGGLGSRLGAPWADRIARIARDAVFGQATFDVVTSALGDDAGVIGAATLFH
ncbi:MAG TPA: ROK family protein [Acidimicrobiales bacterium]|nr:ROK family protein [Acidimicrobiales bacterium]